MIERKAELRDAGEHQGSGAGEQEQRGGADHRRQSGGKKNPPRTEPVGGDTDQRDGQRREQQAERAESERRGLGHADDGG